MTIPWPEGRPEQSVGADATASLTQGLQVLVRKFDSLERVIATQTAMQERTMSAASRYQMAGMGQMRQDVLQGVASSGGSLHGARTSQMTPMGAMSSLENLQAYGAQKLGQWIAGTPLYEMPQQQADPGSNIPAGQTVSRGGQGGGGTYQFGGGGQGGVYLPPVAPRGPSSPAGGGGGGGGGAPPAPAPAPQPNPMGRTAILRQVGARVAMSGGGGFGSVTNALRGIPGVGLIMDIANKGADFYLNQREAGRTYQEIEGGANISAQTERLHQAAYQASMFGRMPENDAAQAFGGVTAMGFNMANSPEMGHMPQNRQSALDFIYHNYTQTGMDTQQSLQALQAASQDANVQLKGLGDTLHALSDQAGQAGTNADTARQQFLSYFSTALGQGAGNGAATVAGGISTMQASMGKEFAGVNFSGELSQSRQYLLSGMAGVSPAQLQYTQRNNPGAYNKLLAGQNMQFLTQGGLMTPAMQSSLQQMIGAVGGGNSIMTDPSLRDQVATQFLNQWQLKGNINQDLWAQEISALTGVNMTPTQAFQWIVSQSAGVNEASHNAGLPGGQSGPNPGATVRAGNIGSAPTGRYGLAQSRTGVTDRISSLFEHGNVGGESWQSVLKSAGPAGSTYLSQEQKSGRRSPVLEAILQNTSQGDQVRVQTSSGTRVMSIADAMKYYPEEMAAGNVEFYNSSGAAMGNTASVTHGLVNQYANVGAEEKQKAGANLGVTAASWDAAHKSSQVQPAAGGQAVQITLSAEAQQLLKLLPSNHDQAAATSQVPANPYASQASR